MQLKLDLIKISNEDASHWFIIVSNHFAEVMHSVMVPHEQYHNSQSNIKKVLSRIINWLEGNHGLCNQTFKFLKL